MLKHHEDRLHSFLSSLQLMLFHVAAIKRLPVHHHSADYIFFIVLWDPWAHSSAGRK